MSSYTEKDLKIIRRIFTDCFCISLKKFTKDKLPFLKTRYNISGDLIISLPESQTKDLKGSKIGRFEKDMNIVVTESYLSQLGTTKKELYNLIKANETGKTL